MTRPHVLPDIATPPDGPLENPDIPEPQLPETGDRPPVGDPPTQRPPAEDPPSREPPQQDPPSREPPEQDPPSREPPEELPGAGDQAPVKDPPRDDQASFG